MTISPEENPAVLWKPAGPFFAARMFELDKYEPQLRDIAPSTPDLAYEPVRSVRRMSLLFWAEHCVECAAPDCYQSCDLYQPRTDGRCRRFTYGAMKNPAFSSLRGYGVEISFKKWAKIEAFANFSLFPAQSVLWGERLIECAAPASNVIGNLAEKATGKFRWRSATLVALEELVRRLSDRRVTNDRPDAFLLEVYNPGASALRLQLKFAPPPPSPSDNHVPAKWAPSFVTTVDLPAGYSRRQIEFSLLREVAAAGTPFLISMIPEGDSHARLIFLTADFVQFAANRAEAGEANKVKCVVWDLDNTIWKGVLAEGDDVALQPGIAFLLKTFDERGILLSIASKNDHHSAWRKLLDLGIAGYFVAPQINWAPKSQNIRRISERLNLGLDAFAFVDDSPFERDDVSRNFPGVVCLHAREILSLAADPRFQGSTSADARRRRQFYQEADVREQAREEFGSDYLGFLAVCQITLTIAPFSPEDSERVAELVQRTNQLNFSGRKYTRTQLEAVLADARIEKLVLSSFDRYGSYGTIGFAMLDSAEGMIRILDFMLSCRVQGKLLEQAFFSHLFEHHNPANSKALWVNFQETPRNKPARQVLELLNFRRCERPEGGGNAGMICDSPESLRCEFIQVRCAALSLPEPASTIQARDETVKAHATGDAWPARP